MSEPKGFAKETAVVRVRFAPSPTGTLHIGSARTALFNWLVARSMGGALVLRIEDTDPDRSTSEFEAAIMKDLSWLGLTWDEGPDVGGPHAPYRQSERAAAGIYADAVAALTSAGAVYECFCLPEELATERRAALLKKKPPRYSGKCRRLSSADRSEMRAAGREPALRFAVPETDKVVFDDLIRGPMEFSTEVLGDFIIMRENGVPTYNFAAAIDDLQMEITHVIRGEDHLTNTARQLLILEALDAKVPVFAHLSMILGTDKAKLSKRHGAAAIADYREEGYLATAILNYLALLSWSSPSGREIVSLEELLDQFSIDRVSKSPAIFDAARLRWFNASHIRALQPRVLAEMARPFMSVGPDSRRFAGVSESGLIRVMTAVQTELDVLADAPTCAKILFTSDYSSEVRERLSGEMARAVIKELIEALESISEIEPDRAKEIIFGAKQRLVDRGMKAKDVFQTMRLVFTGELSGPEVWLLLYALGPAGALERLRPWL